MVREAATAECPKEGPRPEWGPTPMAPAGDRCQAGFMPPEGLEVPDAPSPIPRVSEGRRQPRISRPVAVILVIASEVGAFVTLCIAFVASFCDDPCPRLRTAVITITTIATYALGFGGPIMVAWLRRNVVWALTPFVIIGLLWLVNGR